MYLVCLNDHLVQLLVVLLELIHLRARQLTLLKQIIQELQERRKLIRVCKLYTFISKVIRFILALIVVLFLLAMHVVLLREGGVQAIHHVAVRDFAKSDASRGGTIHEKEQEWCTYRKSR